MSIETNKATARRFIEEEFNQNPQGAVEFAAQDYLNHDPSGKTMQGASQNLASFRAAFPDLHATITQILGEGDLVAVQWTARGTHQGPVAHLSSEFVRPGTGNAVIVTGVSLIRFSGDRLAEVWNHWDSHHLLSQMHSA